MSPDALHAEDQRAGARVAELERRSGRSCAGLSCGWKTSSPGRSGSMSDMCSASPWPRPVENSPVPLSSIGAGAVHDLVSSVAVHVADAEVVIALAAPGGVWIRRAGVAGVEGPDVGERAVAPVPGREHRARVVAAGHDQAGPLAVEIGDAGQEAIHAVAVVVAPVARPCRAGRRSSRWPAPRRSGR